MLRLSNPRQKALAVLLGFVVISIGLAAYRYFFPSPVRVSLPTELPLSPSDRVLVVAPHSDDETLGSGGLIERAISEGAQVRVVLLTNGDGFTLAAAEQFHTLHTTPADYIRLAYERQRETQAALQVLGVPPSSVTFLGYPDRGLAPMWTNFWAPSTPFFSRFTQTDHSPYSNSLTPGALYSGQSLVEDLRKVLLDYQPTILIVPHPNDVHPDHWAGYNFVTYTMEELKGQGYAFAASARVYLYLVHSGDWPAPKGLHLGSELVPPAPLLHTQTHWFKFELDPKGTWAKYQAILQYHSQVALMRRYLESFARKNDLFGTLPPHSVPLVAAGSLRTGENEAAWKAVPELVQDPRSDTVTRRLEGSADLTNLRTATDGARLYIRLEARRPVSPRVQYILHLRPLRHLGEATSQVTGTTAARSPDIDIFLRPGSPPVVTGAPAGTVGDLRQAAVGDAIEISIALADLHYPQEIFFGAETHMLVPVDHLAWTLAPLPSTAQPAAVTRK